MTPLLEVSFRGLPHLESIESAIQRWVARLEGIGSSVQRAEVVIEPDGRKTRISVTVLRPDGTIEATTATHADIYVAVADAIRALHQSTRRRSTLLPPLAG
jgi:ribosome-associated translation inhibitor RaiA